MRSTLLLACLITIISIVLSQPPSIPWTLLNTYPHDSDAFTQGLIYEDGVFYESAGLFQKSNIRKVEVTTGRVIKQQRIDDQYFAEGLTSWDDKLVQFTWQAKKGFVYDKDFNFIQEWTYNTQGWGLAKDDSNLIMSDGSSTIFYLDPVTFEVTCSMRVLDGNVPVSNLNELEYIYDYIFANIWFDTRIAIISPRTGSVISYIELESLKNLNLNGNVVNGIAYNAENDTLYVTGKQWSFLYEISIDKTKIPITSSDQVGSTQNGCRSNTTVSTPAPTTNSPTTPTNPTTTPPTTPSTAAAAPTGSNTSLNSAAVLTVSYGVLCGVILFCILIAAVPVK